MEAAVKDARADPSPSCRLHSSGGPDGNTRTSILVQAPRGAESPRTLELPGFPDYAPSTIADIHSYDPGSRCN